MGQGDHVSKIIGADVAIAKIMEMTAEKLGPDSQDMGGGMAKPAIGDILNEKAVQETKLAVMDFKVQKEWCGGLISELDKVLGESGLHDNGPLHGPTTKEGMDVNENDNGPLHGPLNQDLKPMHSTSSKRSKLHSRT